MPAGQLRRAQVAMPISLSRPCRSCLPPPYRNVTLLVRPFNYVLPWTLLLDCWYNAANAAPIACERSPSAAGTMDTVSR